MDKKKMNMIFGAVVVIIVLIAVVFVVKGLMTNKKDNNKKQEKETGYKYVFCYLDEEGKNGMYTHISQTLYFEEGKLKRANLDKNTDVMGDEDASSALQKLQTECEKNQEASMKYPGFMTDCQLEEKRQTNMQTLDLDTINNMSENEKKPTKIGSFDKMYFSKQNSKEMQKVLEGKGYTCSTSS